MSITQVSISDANRAKLETIAHRTGQSPDEVVNQALQQLPDASDSQSDLESWRAALKQVRGMWKDRDDLPGYLEQLRRDWDRRLTGENT